MKTFISKFAILLFFPLITIAQTAPRIDQKCLNGQPIAANKHCLLDGTVAPTPIVVPIVSTIVPTPIKVNLLAAITVNDNIQLDNLPLMAMNSSGLELTYELTCIKNNLTQKHSTPKQ